MMIRTKYLGPTNTKGSRIKASVLDNGTFALSSTVSWDYSVDTEENHVNAALALLAKVNQAFADKYTGGVIQPESDVVRVSAWTPDGYMHIITYRSYVKEVTQ